MIHEIQSEIRDNVSGYLTGRISMPEMQNWLWPCIASVEDAGEEVRMLAGTIGNLISEYSYGDRSEDSMREELAAAILPFDPESTAPPVQSMDVPYKTSAGNLGWPPSKLLHAQGMVSSGNIKPSSASVILRRGARVPPQLEWGPSTGTSYKVLGGSSLPWAAAS